MSVRQLLKGLETAPPLWVQTEEDIDTTLQAFGTLRGARVLCIASGGDTPLSLLRAGAREVVAVDVNPAQVAVAELKVRSVQLLDLASLEALWLSNDPIPRYSAYRSVEGALRTESRQILREWIDQAAGTPLIERGGMQGVGTELRAMYPLLAEKLPAWFETKGLSEQRKYYAKHLDGLADAVARLRQSRAEYWFGGGGEADAEVAAEMQGRFVRRFRHLTEDVHVAGNPYVAHMLFGAYPDNCRPWYLTAEGLAGFKSTGVVEFMVGEVVEVLAAQPQASLDFADLSNVTDLLSEREAAELFRRLGAVLRPGGKCVHRNLVWDEPYPAAGGFVRDFETSRILTHGDRSFVYPAVTVDVLPVR